MEKQRSRLLAMILCTAILLSGIPVTSVVAEEETPTAFYFDCHNKTGYVDEPFNTINELTYTFEPSWTSESITMVSSDSEVASVEYDSMWGWIVDYRSVGTAVITATTESGLMDTCTVTVKEMETAVLDQSFTVEVQPGDELHYCFVPKEVGYYCFYSQDEIGECFLTVESGDGSIEWSGEKQAYGEYTAEDEWLLTNQEFLLKITNRGEKIEKVTVCIRKCVLPERIYFEQEYYWGYAGWGYATDEYVDVEVNLEPLWSVPATEFITLTSSDENVAYFIDPEHRYGRLMVNTSGTTTITATCENGLSAQCMLKIHGKEAINPGDKNTITLQPGEEARYSFTAKEDGEYVFYMPYGENQEELDIRVLDIDPANIWGGIYPYGYRGYLWEMHTGDTCEIVAKNVNENVITRIVYLEKVNNPENIEIKQITDPIFSGRPFELVCAPVEGLPFLTEYDDVTWSVENEEIATLDGIIWGWGRREFSAITPGKTKITATLNNGVSVTYEVTVHEYVYYDIIDRSDYQIVPGTGEPFIMTVDCPVEKFSGLYVDGVAVPEDQYTVTSGSTIITLSAEYLNTLDLGEHWLEAQFIDGGAGAGFNISEPHDHDYIAHVIVPTCTGMGYTTYNCSICGYFYADDVKDPLGHNFVNGECTRCAETDPNYEEPIDPTEPEEPKLDGVYRIAGADRIETSLMLADQLKEVLGVEKFNAVIVSSALNFPDALTGSYLAAVKDAPILLTYDMSHEKVLAYIGDNLAPGGTVYILGGESAVSAAFENMAKAAGLNTKRVAGSDRFATNLAIMEEAGIRADQPILIATAVNFADSLSASAAGLPMVLVHGSLREDQKAFLNTTSGEFIIIGGTAAVSEELEAELAAIGTVERLAGDSRYQTSVLVAQKFLAAPEAVILAYARNFPDGLCGGPVAYALGAPLILTDNILPLEADAYVDGMEAGIVVGGGGLISDETAREIFELAVDMPIE